MIGVDITCIITSVLLAHWFRYAHNWTDQNLDLIALMLIGIYLFSSLLIQYNEDFFVRGYFEELIQVVKIHAFMLICATMILYLIKRSTDVSRLLFGYFYLCDIILMYLGRLVLKRVLSHNYRYGKRSRRMIVVARSSRMQGILEELKKNHSWEYTVVCAAASDRDMTGEVISGTPIVTSVECLAEYVRLNAIDEVFIRLEKEDIFSVEKLVEDLQVMGTVVDVSINIFDIEIHSEKIVSQIGKYQTVTFCRKILTYNQLAMKRLVDIAGSLVGMLLLFVVSIVVVPAIKMESPGPAIFCQTRIGKNGRKFKLYKFRSMYQGAEKQKQELMKYNEMDAQGLMFKMHDDPRVTKVGRFIRRTCIDELPQFWNVLKGDMSLVGTRPPTVDEFERYKPEYKSRLCLIPGLTGLWQVSGKNEISEFEDVVRLDREYIDHWSMKADVKIILKTIIMLIAG